ncbi:unnamed protein product [Protopolystoma xenopodis]|uniref:Uncharacterized protein n=1 Tax=Protopolystoma xenopodis TaxID=117903 RepID=A0A448WEM3_9PLAT|nr:unnamed protein product [Protopolystoma xenopodis]
MAKLTDDSHYDADETLIMYQVHCQMLVIMTITMTIDFGQGLIRISLLLRSMRLLFVCVVSLILFITHLNYNIAYLNLIAQFSFASSCKVSAGDACHTLTQSALSQLSDLGLEAPSHTLISASEDHSRLHIERKLQQGLDRLSELTLKVVALHNRLVHSCPQPDS